MYAYERTKTPKLPWKPRSLPIDLGRSKSRSKRSVRARTTCGTGRNGSIRSEHGDRPRARAAAAVRLGEGLVQVEVDDVEAHVAGPGHAHHRVQVRAVVVERRAGVVDDLGDLLDVAVEQPERVRVREHQAGHVVAGLLAQVVEVHPAVRRRSHLHDLVAGHRHGRRVGAVGGVGREHLRALLAAVLVVGAGEQQARQLAVRPGARLERHVRQARRSRRARPGGATSARARPARTPGPGAGAAARGRAAPPRARAASGCASSCTSRAGRSPRPGGSSSRRASCSGAPARAPRSPGSSAGRSRIASAGSSSSTGTSGTSVAGSGEGAATRAGALEDRERVLAHTPTSARAGAPTSSASRSMCSLVRRSVTATRSPSENSG